MVFFHKKFEKPIMSKMESRGNGECTFIPKTETIFSLLFAFSIIKILKRTANGLLFGGSKKNANTFYPSLDSRFKC